MTEEKGFDASDVAAKLTTCDQERDERTGAFIDKVSWKERTGALAAWWVEEC